MKEWYKKAIDLLDHSLKPVPQELNEIDWKETLSPNSKKLSKHLSAFANLPGGGYLVFGIEDNTANPIGISKVDAEQVVQRLSSICRDSLFPVITIDHTIQTYEGVSLLFVYVKESGSTQHTAAAASKSRSGRQAGRIRITCMSGAL